MITLQALCFGILGYLLGATPYGLIIARVFCHTDPRTGGSHNTGATNVARMCGFGWGVATLACDLLKGALPVFLAQMETGSPVVVTVAALSAVLGHVFSCFMHFKGGKAVATSIGVFLPIAFPPPAHRLPSLPYRDLAYGVRVRRLPHPGLLHAHPALPLRGLSVAAAFPLRAGHRGLAAQGEY